MIFDYEDFGARLKVAKNQTEPYERNQQYEHMLQVVMNKIKKLVSSFPDNDSIIVELTDMLSFTKVSAIKDVPGWKCVTVLFRTFKPVIYNANDVPAATFRLFYYNSNKVDDSSPEFKRLVSLCVKQQQIHNASRDSEYKHDSHMHVWYLHYQTAFRFLKTIPGWSESLKKVGGSPELLEWENTNIDQLYDVTNKLFNRCLEAITYIDSLKVVSGVTMEPYPFKLEFIVSLPVSTTSYLYAPKEGITNWSSASKRGFIPKYINFDSTPKVAKEAAKEIDNVFLLYQGIWMMFQMKWGIYDPKRPAMYTGSAQGLMNEFNWNPYSSLLP